MRKRINLIFGAVVLLAMAGCTSYSSLLNFNEAPGIPVQPQPILNFQPITIQPNDILKIQVSSTDAIAAKPFSVASENGGATDGSMLNDYLVNSDGEIVLPTLGPIQVKGLTVEQVKATLTGKLEPYFNQPPIIRVRLINFKVNVNGEVVRPGSFNVLNDRLTIIEAVTLAGDFTPYSRRDSILIIREEDGMRSFGYVDFNSSELFNSPYFYLQQNDVVYVQPEKTKVNSVRDPSSRFLPWVTAIVSITAIIISITR